jgi:hypothetical protein
MSSEIPDTKQEVLHNDRKSKNRRRNKPGIAGKRN